MVNYNPTLRLDTFDKMVVDGVEYSIEERCSDDEFIISWGGGSNQTKIHIDEMAKMIHGATEVEFVNENG